MVVFQRQHVINTEPAHVFPPHAPERTQRLYRYGRTRGVQPVVRVGCCVGPRPQPFGQARCPNHVGGAADSRRGVNASSVKALERNKPPGAKDTAGKARSMGSVESPRHILWQPAHTQRYRMKSLKKPNRVGARTAIQIPVDKPAE